MEKDIGIDEKEHNKAYLRILYSKIPNEEQMERALLYYKNNRSLKQIHIWVFDCISYYGELGVKWKDFFLRHGMINEKEEFIYKPEDK